MNARRKKARNIDRKLEDIGNTLNNIEDMGNTLNNKGPTMFPSLNQLFLLKILLEEWKFSEEHDELNGNDVAAFLIHSLDHLMYLKTFHDIDTPEAYIRDQLDWNTRELEGANEDDIDSLSRWQTFWEATAWEYDLWEHAHER
jgi:hypothetical protein